MSNIGRVRNWVVRVSVNLLLFLRSPSHAQAEWNNEINKVSPTLTPRFRTLNIGHLGNPSKELMRKHQQGRQGKQTYDRGLPVDLRTL